MKFIFTSLQKNKKEQSDKRKRQDKITNPKGIPCCECADKEKPEKQKIST